MVNVPANIVVFWSNMWILASSIGYPGDVTNKILNMKGSKKYKVVHPTDQISEGEHHHQIKLQKIDLEHG